MFSHGRMPPSSPTLKRWPMSLDPNMVTWLFTARSEQAALKRVECPTIQLVMNPP